MAHVDDTMPPNDVIRGALRKTTERLVSEISAPQAQAPGWSDVEWRVAMAAAVMHGMSGLLHSRLRWPGPDVWEAFLADQKRQSVLRQRRITGLLAQLDAAGRAQGLPMLAMKGSALLRLGLHAEGERPMSDIDLLVRPRDSGRALQLLQALGYVVEFGVARHVSLRPAGWPEAVAFGEHDGNPVKIELHTRVYEALPIHEVDITALAFPVHARDGINAYASMAALMRHLLLHTTGNLRGGSVRFIQLHDIASLARRFGPQDWEELARGEGDDRALWWALPVLRLVSRQFPGAVPASVLRQVEQSSRWLLRWSSRRSTLVDVSLSSAKIPALPGLSWSASPAEALQVISSRLMPGREQRSIRRQALTEPAYAGSRWDGTPRFAKILLWARGRAPQLATSYSIRQALAYRPADVA